MSVGISLGWNCSSATRGVDLGIRQRKINGYKTCPFDEMNSNYEGVVKCIQNDFEGFTDPEYLELIQIPSTANYHKNDTLIYNKKYKFLFNHESPGHANLYITQCWEGGINHFIDNNYAKFKERYERRIENFRNYLNSGNQIQFLLTKPDTDYTKLITVLDSHYPQLNYSILHFSVNDMNAYTEIHNQMNLCFID